jgi:hypothetical protein
MTCCEPSITPFTLQPTTTIAWTVDMQELYGSKPNVQVYYRESSGEYVLSDDMNGVVFDGATIEVDHGGSQTGFIKVF